MKSLNPLSILHNVPFKDQVKFPEKQAPPITFQKALADIKWETAMKFFLWGQNDAFAFTILLLVFFPNRKGKPFKPEHLKYNVLKKNLVQFPGPASQSSFNGGGQINLRKSSY